MGDDLDPARARAMLDPARARAMPSPARARAMLEWQIEAGVTEAVGEAPVDRLAPAPRAASDGDRPDPPDSGHPRERPAAPDHRAAASPSGTAPDDPVAAAHAAAAAAADLPALRAAVAAYPHCELRRGARGVVFADGIPGARVMIVGEAPGRDEDIAGLPFVGRSGQLLDLMLAAIGLSRRAEDPARGVYITNVMPWRPPQNRDPKAGEIAMMKPFLERHVALAAPEILVPMGNPACAALLGVRGITKLRGVETEALGLPALPMLHPAYLLRNPVAKREAWADLLTLEERLNG